MKSSLKKGVMIFIKTGSLSKAYSFSGIASWTQRLQFFFLILVWLVYHSSIRGENIAPHWPSIGMSQLPGRLIGHQNFA